MWSCPDPDVRPCLHFLLYFTFHFSESISTLQYKFPTLGLCDFFKGKVSDLNVFVFQFLLHLCIYLFVCLYVYVWCVCGVEEGRGETFVKFYTCSLEDNLQESVLSFHFVGPGIINPQA